jgi:hypothetical protein
MERQEIGDGKANRQCQGPDDRRIGERFHVERIGQAGAKQLQVIPQHERRTDSKIVVVEEADGYHHRQRYAEKHQQDGGQRCHLEIRHDSR